MPTIKRNLTPDSKMREVRFQKDLEIHKQFQAGLRDRIKSPTSKSWAARTGRTLPRYIVQGLELPTPSRDEIPRSRSIEMPTIKKNYPASLFGNPEATKRAIKDARTYGNTALESEGASAAKASARARSYDTWKQSKTPSSNVERRGSGRMTDAEYKKWQTTPRAPSKIPTLNYQKTGPFEDFLKKSRQSKIDYVKELRTQPKTAGQKVDSFLGASAKKFAPVGRLASKVANIPGAKYVGKAMGRLAVPVMVGQGLYDLGRMAYEGVKAVSASRESASERRGSEAKYGTIERATTTRKNRPPPPKRGPVP